MSKETAFQALQQLSDEEADLLNSSPDLLAKFKAKHGLEQSSMAEKAYNYTASALSPTLKILNYSDKLGGQAIQSARQGVGQLMGLPPTQENDPSFIGETVGGLQALNRMAFSPITGENALQAGRNEVLRPKNRISDAANQLAFSLMAPEVAGAPANALVQGAVQLGRGGSALLKKIAEKIGPRLLAKTAGIPERATEMALKNPALTKGIPGIDGKIDEATGNVLTAIKQAKAQEGAVHGATYQKFALLQNPMEQAANPPLAQKLIKEEVPIQVGTKLVPQVETNTAMGPTGNKTRLIQGDPLMGKKTILKAGPEFEVKSKYVPLETVKGDASRIEFALQNDETDYLRKIQKRYMEPGREIHRTGPLSDDEKLHLLTNVKRTLNNSAKFSPAGTELPPINPVDDAAVKSLASNLDSIRGKIKGGEEMSKADDRWHAVHEVYDTIQKSLSTDGKAKDELLKLFKRDPTGITAGRTQEKLDAIKKVEEITGKPVLQPLMELLTKREFSKGMGKGLSHSLLLGGGIGSAATAAATGHPAAAIGALGTMAAGSPALMGAGIRGASNLAKFGQDVAAASKVVAPMAALTASLKPLTRDIAVEFLKKAKGNKKRAEAMAKDKGYDTEKLVDE